MDPPAIPPPTHQIEPSQEFWVMPPFPVEWTFNPASPSPLREVLLVSYHTKPFLCFHCYCFLCWQFTLFIQFTVLDYVLVLFASQNVVPGYLECALLNCKEQGLEPLLSILSIIINKQFFIFILFYLIFNSLSVTILYTYTCTSIHLFKSAKYVTIMQCKSLSGIVHKKQQNEEKLLAL